MLRFSHSLKYQDKTQRYVVEYRVKNDMIGKIFDGR
jgi:hypothetical protein